MHGVGRAEITIDARDQVVIVFGGSSGTLNVFVGQNLTSFTAEVTAQALKEVGDLIESGRISP
jgi:hypothetical protein